MEKKQKGGIKKENEEKRRNVMFFKDVKIHYHGSAVNFWLSNELCAFLKSELLMAVYFLEF